MKIVYGITKSNFGGAQRYVFDLAVESKKAGFDTVVMCGGEGPLVKKLKEAGVRVISIPGFGRDTDFLHDASRLWFIIKTVWKEKPDVFHINSAKMGGAGIFSGRLLGVPKIIFTAHGWAFNEPRPEWQKVLIKFFTWATIFFAHKTICVSEKTRADIAHWPFIKNKLIVIYNGIESFELKPRIDASFIVGTIAELHKIKGLDVLLESWKEFKKTHSGNLVIVGEGEEKQNLQNRAKNLSILDSVIFQGFVDNARSFLLGFDIFVLPSRSENLPYAILEAGFAKRAVIASRVGGIPEIIQNENCGILVEKENVSALAEALIKLANDRNLRETLGNNLNKVVTEQFSKEKMMRDTLALYK
jgi:glycosyltransferase involved in cell wall biosynthesis